MFKLKSLKIPDGVTTIDYGLFFGCKDLESVNIPETVTSVKDSAFYGCNSLTDIEIPERVTSIGDSAFSYCNSLSSITILNPQCEIEDNLYVIPDNTTIRGYGGSTAESYAQKYGKYFETIDDQPIVTTPAVGYEF